MFTAVDCKGSKGLNKYMMGDVLVVLCKSYGKAIWCV